jgi:hypothetical protein
MADDKNDSVNKDNKGILNDEIEVNEILNDTDVELNADGGTSGTYKLPSGNALSLQELYEITASEDTKIIILVGPSACGKTTIETTIYQMFYDGTVNGYYFAGSKTIQAYEHRSFNTRVKSKQNVPTTPRTIRGVQDIFLHLRLWNEKTQKFTNFLFADLSGEDFESHRADTDAMKKNFAFIKYADYIIAVLDGDLISTKKNRNSTFDSITELLRTMAEAEIFNSRTNLQAVISKYDIVSERASGDINIESYINNIASKLEQRTGLNIVLRNIAAMPNNISKYAIGYGIEDLMASWCTKSTKNIRSYDSEKDLNLNSEFNKLYRKLLGDMNESF